jgi:hypothetical protein
MSFLKPVVNINKYEIHIKSLLIGDVITFKEIITIDSKTPDSDSDNTFANDIIIGTLKNEHFSTNSHLWVRHFLNSCEFENNVSISEGLSNKSTDPDSYHFPNSIKIVVIITKPKRL